MNAKQLRDLADSLFSKKMSLLNLQQEISENFYPERADFTVRRHLGVDFAGNLMTSYPILCRRDLGDQIGTMLRNTNKPWFHNVVKDQNRQDHETRQWLEWSSEVMRSTMYAPATQFNKATTQADHDFSAFGGACLTVRLNSKADDLIYRTWHLRDLAWMEDEEGKICGIFRRWKPTIYTLMRLFNAGRPGTSLDSKIIRRAAKEPNAEIDCYHFMVAADMYDGPNNGMPWRSIYYDCDNKHEMQSVAQRRKEYVIPRWLTVSGSQYPHSPATVAALPEGRLLQAMTYTLLEAGEKVVNPPIIAVEQALRSDVALYSGAITYIDRDYDERTGEALRPLVQDAKGMPLSKDMQADSRSLLAQCFYLNRLKLPTNRPQMTAYEVGQYIQEYVRNALPLFEPMEAEYNGALCEETFSCIADAGGFGYPGDWPRKIRGADVVFRFASPLHDAIEQQKGAKFLEVSQLLAQAAAIDKGVYGVVDAKVALRDALYGIQTPTKWTRSEGEVDAMEAKQAADAQTASLLANLQAAGGAAKDLATAGSLAPKQAAPMPA